MTAVIAIAALALAACGSSDNPTSATGTRTIEIEMRDIKFSPDEVQVKAGETIRFVFNNAGKVAHDAFIGNEAAQDAHEMEMRNAGSGDMTMDSAGGGGAGQGGITVAPGDKGELTYTFREGDQLVIGCHQEGHYEAGMKVMVEMS